jgi:hypothetical protein
VGTLWQEQYRLFGTVRYRWMTTDELAQTQAANVVPSDFIIEVSAHLLARSVFLVRACMCPMTLIDGVNVQALMARLKEAERDRACEESEAGPCTEQDSKRLRLLPRPSFGILFDYAYDYDKKGIIFWIATNRGRGKIIALGVPCRWRGSPSLTPHTSTSYFRTEPWTNPHSAGRLRVTASSIEKGDPVKLVAKKPSELWSGTCALGCVCNRNLNSQLLTSSLSSHKVTFRRHGSPLTWGPTGTRSSHFASAHLPSKCIANDKACTPPQSARAQLLHSAPRRQLQGRQPAHLGPAR